MGRDTLGEWSDAGSVLRLDCTVCGKSYRMFMWFLNRTDYAEVTHRTVFGESDPAGRMLFEMEHALHMRLMGRGNWPEITIIGDIDFVEEMMY